jgi:DNA-binding transcriptional LysR family regulator
MSMTQSRIYSLVKNFDLNLLVILKIVYTYESVTKAAKFLNVTPSAISQALQKLRFFFNDPLFIRENNRLRPTLLGDELYNEIEKMLSPLMEYIISTSISETKPNFVIFCSHYYSWSIFPSFLNYIHEREKKYTIKHISQYNMITTDNDALSQQFADITLDINKNENPSHISEVIFKDHLILICSKNHPRANAYLTQDTLGNERFVSIDNNSLEAKKIKRYIEFYSGGLTYAFSTSSLMTLFSVVEHTHLLALVPSRVYDRFKHTYSITHIDLTENFKLPDINLYITYKKTSLKNKTFKEVILIIKKLFKNSNWI